MALFSTNHTLTQGSLHYRLATLGYQKQKAMGFVNLQTSFAPLFLLTRDEIKKAQHLRRCVPLNVLTQGSSLRSPTLGYQNIPQWGASSSQILQKDSVGAPLSLERGWGGGFNASALSQTRYFPLVQPSFPHFPPNLASHLCP